MSREQLIEIFNNVRYDINTESFTNSLGEEASFKNLQEMFLGTEKILDPGITVPDDRKYEDFISTKIYVTNNDFLNQAVKMNDPDLAILNPASAKKAGGGVRNGSRALEEIICRRSTLIKSLEKFVDDTTTGLYTERLGDLEAIWSPYVNIYRDENYLTLEKPVLVNVVTSAAINHPQLTKDGKYTPDSEKLMKMKIRSILRIAILKGMTKILFPAWGCGAFANPAREVSRCFKEVFSESEFIGAFEEICFAILDDHNANHEFNPEGNYKPFVDTFGTK